MITAVVTDETIVIAVDRSQEFDVGLWWDTMKMCGLPNEYDGARHVITGALLEADGGVE